MVVRGGGRLEKMCNYSVFAILPESMKWTSSLHRLSQLSALSSADLYSFFEPTSASSSCGSFHLFCLEKKNIIKIVSFNSIQKIRERGGVEGGRRRTGLL